MNTIYDIFRLIIYAWASIEAFLLFHLYSYGFAEIKKSKIIAALSLVFSAIGSYMLFVLVMAVTRLLDTETYIYISQFASVFAILIAICLKWFREESLKKPNKKL